jgi:hypothetical protein
MGERANADGMALVTAPWTQYTSADSVEFFGLGKAGADPPRPGGTDLRRKSFGLPRSYDL